MLFQAQDRNALRDRAKRGKKQKRSLSERVAKRSLDKDLMRKVVRKKRRRRPPVTSAGVPFLHGYATTEEFEGWLAANLACWKRVIRICQVIDPTLNISYRNIIFLIVT